MNEALSNLIEFIQSSASDKVLDHFVEHGELTVTIPPQSVVEFIAHLQTATPAQFTTLVDITAIDWPDREKRFDLVYHLLSMRQNLRIRIKAAVREDEIVPSISSVHPSANWFEREVFDMYGILFSGHPDLRRILTDYGFQGYPLRKDFPTTGYVEMRYDEAAKRCIYEPVKLTQDYRQFDFMSPWEGAEYILPGDEKKESA
jgi:NADH-quinone oxidoreductase subunit C